MKLECSGATMETLWTIENLAYYTSEPPPINVIHIEHELNWTRADDMGGISFSVTASLGGSSGILGDQILEG